MKLKHIKPGLCKITYFLWVINVCHINLNVKVKKEEKRKIKSIMSPGVEERHFFFHVILSLYPKLTEHTETQRLVKLKTKSALKYLILISL